MTTTDRVRPRAGDIIEIPTPLGFAYAQYTHRHVTPPRHGALLRVLPGIFSERPTDFSRLTQEKERFLVFFPLGAACSRGIVRVVAEEPIPSWAKAFPVFRHGNADASGHVDVWYLWDGDREWRVGALSAAQQKLPIHPGVVNDTALIEMIVEGCGPDEEPANQAL